MKRKILAIVPLVAALLFQVTPVQPRGWVLEAGALVPVSLNAGMVEMPSLKQADLDGDGTAEALYIRQETAFIEKSGISRWQSPPGWQVLDAQVTHLTGDGQSEAALLVWRPFRAWPVDRWLPSGGRIAGFHDAEGNSCQIILIGWKNGQYAEEWAGSPLAEPVRQFRAADLNGDGKQELITLDGLYGEPRLAPAHFLKVWEWNGFGFSNVYSQAGRFAGLALARSPEGKMMILVP